MVEWLIVLQVVTLPPQARPRPISTLHAPPCGTECRQRLPVTRYVLAGKIPRADDPVVRAMRAGEWSRCGLSGMPVCPSKGHILFSGPIAALLGGN